MTKVDSGLNGDTFVSKVGSLRSLLVGDKVGEGIWLVV